MTLLTHIMAAATAISPGDLPKAMANTETLKKIISTVLSIIGALSLLMITVSGLRYILSGGDEQKVAKAKNGIIYSLVGLAVAISAQAIVAFVVKRL